MQGMARETWRRAMVRTSRTLVVVLTACCGTPADARDASAHPSDVPPASSDVLPQSDAGVRAAPDDEDTSSSPVELPLVATAGRLLTRIGVADTGTHWFIIDTAAGRSLISAALRRKLDLPRADVRFSTVSGATGRTIMEFVRLPTLQLGPTAHEKLWVIVADIPDFRRYGKREVSGILGVDVLAQYDVALDIPAGILRLHPRDGSAAKARGGSGIPFHSTVAEGFVQFTARLDGDSVSALLDTGARTGAMNWSAASLAGIAADRDGVREDRRGARGMSGQRVAAHRYTFENLCIGERCLPPTELQVVDLPAFDALGGPATPVLLIGADALYDCALLLSYSTKRLHFCD